MFQRAPLFYYLPYLFIAIAFAGFLHQGFLVFAGAIAVLIIRPILDASVKTENRTETETETVTATDTASSYNPALYLMFPILFAFLIFSWRCLKIASSEIEIVGILLTSGIMLGAFGITTAHELVHRRSKFEEAIGYGILVLIHFTHFAICHIKGHHKHVATPQDPATARKGESLYSYWLRSIPGEFSEAYEIEKERVEKKEQNKFIQYLSNKVVRFTLLALFLLGVVAFSMGLNIAIAWVIQSAIALLILSTVDYIEHYGLLRKEIKPGQYEPVRPWHSWDSNQPITNWSLFNLALHSEHHMKVQKTYPQLTENRDAMPLPFGYSTMFLLAFFPPLFKGKMDAIIQAHPSTN